MSTKGKARLQNLDRASKDESIAAVRKRDKALGDHPKYDPIEVFDRLSGYVTRKPVKDITAVQVTANEWLRVSFANKVYYDWTWLGIPIIQTPSDMMVMQELMFRLRPQTVIETGVAHGGSLIFYSSILQLIHGNDYLVIGVEKDFRVHNRKVLERHPMYKNARVVEGDSTSKETIQKVKTLLQTRLGHVMVALDSYHGKDHVLKELELYSQFVTVGSYIVVFDTVVDILEGIELTDPTIGKNNNPKDAVDEFLRRDPRFVIDEACNKLYISHAYRGFLRKVRA
jgi:cephalosporin hydroxylase